MNDTSRPYDADQMDQFLAQLAKGGAHASDALDAVVSQFSIDEKLAYELIQDNGAWDAEFAQSSVLKSLFLNLLDEDADNAA
ncbi:hypothetical protein [Maricaulis sp.]|uniref:hypothetical protein n=1 Tax=Maricaulis sp. TaxID=1486257 RepID=UPI00261F4A30|nr:hypothetical protein [Maricaulis sp.]